MKARLPDLSRVPVVLIIVTVSIITIMGLPLLTGAQPPEPEAAQAGYCYGQAVVGFPVPDNGDSLIVAINLSDCSVPPGATVSRIEIVARFDMDFVPSDQCSDCLDPLRISLANSQHTGVIREYDQDCCGTSVSHESTVSATASYTRTLTESNFTLLNGDPVAGKWFITVEKGCASPASYQILEWEITVHYEGAPPPTPTATQTPIPTPTTREIVQSCYSESGADVHFPEANTWINSPITVDCAPPGSIVAGVEVMVNIAHECPQATKIELRYEGRTFVLWNRQGSCGGVSYFAPSYDDVTTFNGLPANGTWRAYAVDEVGYGTQHYINYWNLIVEYEDGSTPTPTAIAGPSPTPKPPPSPLCRNMLTNGDFESGDLWPWLPWESAGLGSGRMSNHGGWIGGVTDSHSDLHRWVTIPSVLTPVTLRFWWVAEADTPQHSDRLHVFFERGEELNTLIEIPASGPLAQWVQAEADLSPYAGQSGFLIFMVHNDPETPSIFQIDDVEILGCGYFMDLPLIMGR